MSGCDCSPIPRPPTPGAGAAVVALRGDDGEDGAFVPGPPGPSGADGVAGAVVALRGDDGEDGAFVPGPPGPAGAAGVAGAVVALRGDDGEDGAPGVAFAAGLSLANGNLFQVDTDGTTTTTSAAFVVGQTLTAVLGAGLWRVDWYAEFLNNTVGVSTNVETQLDGVTVGTIRQGEDVDALDTEIHSGFCLRVLTNGSHTATIRFSSNGAATATLRRRRLVFIRLG